MTLTVSSNWGVRSTRARLYPRPSTLSGGRSLTFAYTTTKSAILFMLRSGTGTSPKMMTILEGKSCDVHVMCRISQSQDE